MQEDCKGPNLAVGLGCDSDIIVRKDKQEVNGKSIMGIMMLAAECGSKIHLKISGEDAQEAIKELETFLITPETELK